MCLCLYTVLTPHSVSLLHSIFLPDSPPYLHLPPLPFFLSVLCTSRLPLGRGAWDVDSAIHLCQNLYE